MIKNKRLLVKVLATIFYLGMVTINALANILPINNVGTGQISDNYFNLFTPAGLTFSIWGLIYLMLGAYVVYQFWASEQGNKLIEKISPYFIISSLANMAWIFAWHYDFIGLSVLLIILMLLSLIKIADIARQSKFSLKEQILLIWPFSLYFGWITVATIANITVFLVSINWSGWGLANELWTIIILFIGAIIGILRMMRDRSFIYGLVFIWAYLGILIRQVSDLESEYTGIIIALIICLSLFIFSQFWLAYKLKKT